MGEFVEVCKVSEVPSGGGRVVDVGGEPVALFNTQGTFCAIHNTCPHRGGPLGEGELADNTVICPLHGWEFDVTSGKCVSMPGANVKCYQVKVEDERVLVAVP